MFAPINAVSGKEYTGGNIARLAGNYPSNKWATFKQWQALGQCVRKGQKGTQIVYWAKIQKKKISEKTGKIIKDDKMAKKIFYVFNEAQVAPVVAGA